MAFRVSELQALLTFAGENKYGRKNELQSRCLALVEQGSARIIEKLNSLHGEQ